MDLQKGQRVDIGLSKISVGLGWSPKQGTGYDFDLDASAFMLDQNGLIPLEQFFVFYGNTDSPDSALHHSGDDPTGAKTDGGDDETISVDLGRVDPHISEIVFVVTIHDAMARRQNYGQVSNSFIRIVDTVSGDEIVRYDLDDDFSIETAVEFGRLVKYNGQWKFEASGIGCREELAFFLSKYYKGQNTAINLVKGQTVSLQKNDKGDTFDLSQVTIGLGWDIRHKSGGFLGKLLDGKEYDIDAVAFLLNSNGKVASLGRNIIDEGGRRVNLYEGDVVYFNSMVHPSGLIWLKDDNRDGAGAGDDEQIVVKLNRLGPQYDRIVFVIAIYDGMKKHQHFGIIENAFIRAVDAQGREMARYSLSGDAAFDDMCSATFAELYREGGAWSFRALGEPHRTDDFVEVLRHYTDTVPPSGGYTKQPPR